ncbi:TetR family transcriptional regulator [Mycolicibacterium neoaurum]|uniref:TetR/AcrR family transcriptional regulator n=1 Tax=Mycobacterium sp. VKM Ac-1816D TaxID=1273686 RepID=UPI0004EF77B4|nr:MULTISPECIES: TetR/AcrR family transcriptional regulator [Mycobacteriaceae]AHC27146.2 TetR family transcriptional regulator [Mycolicibacterium neoaurum VKM Ac-1815D]AMO07405.1 TetR family transcriptional regulator [Mycolicibacterium neoaurum]AXK74210.1 TetR family transcriptional regulator [Mycolicibacterium neoaurum]KJQ51360.1 TetR family transcriptional regulator [Mycolicibacterium neoaurum]KUM09327.1 TetR family transcriptional regulator [Mycolicibacterium neoaurum]
MAIDDKAAVARLRVSRHAAALFWERGVSGTSGDDIAAAANLSTRTIWRYFRSKEACVEPLLAKSAHRFIGVLDRWPAELSLGQHMRADAIAHPFSEQDLADETAAMRIAAMSATEPALRTAYLMVHDEMERGFIPVIAKRLDLPAQDLTVRLCAAATTAALRVVDEDVSTAVVVDGRTFESQDILTLIDRAVLDATNGRIGAPVST